MPFFIKIYLVLFILLLLSNIIFHSKFKIKIIFLVYEILSALYMIGMIYIYWSPILMEKLNPAVTLPLILILIVDIYFTTLGSLNDLGINLPEIPQKSQETAKIISILFNAPAYIVAILSSFEILKINHLLNF
ncbi:MAG TPA: hypothetical protein DD381_00685 [Lentisphaeria bacterium]|nr:MAG: hypothetical protein A2X47_00335 [Lentisphaerae bacterium GWF2_38_69]HBM14858.1 hypothetical protein [Lentisphaeria bacterium]